ncbi:MAG: hypothetical protein U1D30_10435 [Planctomycetota bacterium]
MDPEKMRQAWQSQSCGTIGDNPDQLLKVVRWERLAQFCVDIGMIAFFFCVSVWMCERAFRDIRQYWPWLISALGSGWVVGYITFNLWLRQRHAARFDDPLLAHVEWSIKDIEHQMWLDRWSPCWYILPLALGCMLPPILFFAMEYGERPVWEGLLPLLGTEFVFVFTFLFVYLVMQFGVRHANEKRYRELQSLRSLRENLSNASE